MSEYVPPEYHKDAFNCPLCGAFTHQVWEEYSRGPFIIPGIEFAHCQRCEKRSIWAKKEVVYPPHSLAPLPHPDLPDEIRKDYEEAREVLARSPRSAAALLRLAMEKLTNYLLSNEKGTDLNDNIRKLVEKGLRIQIKQALDIVRVIGNESVHPGQIDLKDDYITAQKLFKLVNMVVEDRITLKKELDQLYEKIPPEKLEGINQRDSRK